jgi:large subunit ribosomal protein L47
MLRQIIRAGNHRIPLQTRAYSTEIASVSPSNETQSIDPLQRAKKDKKVVVGLRPSFRVPVNPNHGLYGFFRKKEKDGVVSYDSLPDFNERLKTGRSWTAAELRRKSFRDLHTLWYILLRERNLCATQLEEGRRLGILPSDLGHKECLINARKVWFLPFTICRYDLIWGR